jgi:hypothetical protein
MLKSVLVAAGAALFLASAAAQADETLKPCKQVEQASRAQVNDQGAAGAQPASQAKVNDQGAIGAQPASRAQTNDQAAAAQAANSAACE